MAVVDSCRAEDSFDIVFLNAAASHDFDFVTETVLEFTNHVNSFVCRWFTATCKNFVKS